MFTKHYKKEEKETKDVDQKYQRKTHTHIHTCTTHILYTAD